MSAEAALRSIQKTIAISRHDSSRKGVPVRTMAIADRALLRIMAKEERSTWREVRERLIREKQEKDNWPRTWMVDFSRPLAIPTSWLLPSAYCIPYVPQSGSLKG